MLEANKSRMIGRSAEKVGAESRAAASRAKNRDFIILL